MLPVSNFAPPRQQALKANSQREGITVTKEAYELMKYWEKIATKNTSESDFNPNTFRMINETMEKIEAIDDPRQIFRTANWNYLQGISGKTGLLLVFNGEHATDVNPYWGDEYPLNLANLHKELERMLSNIEFLKNKRQ